MFREFFYISKSIIVTPRLFFRKMNLSEGLRKPFLFALFMFYLRNLFMFMFALVRGKFYFLSMMQTVSMYSIIPYLIFLLVSPFIYIFILWFIGKIINRVARFFGGIGNFGAAFKILCYIQFAFVFANFLPFFTLYGIVLAIIGIYEVYRIDVISTLITFFFSFLFAVLVSLLILLPPTIILGIILAPKF